MRNVLMIMGTRPEIIKLGPVYRELAARNDVCVKTCWTGQHLELAKGLIELFGIDVTHKIGNVMSRTGLSEKTGQMLTLLGEFINGDSYHSIIVQGDTLSAMAGAITGFLNRVPVAHVEAGLRTFNLQSPWPEEFSRRIITVATTQHFAPTRIAKGNLLNEGVPARNIHITGNTIVDAIKFVRPKVENGYVPISSQIRNLPANKKLVLVTGHRRENFGEPFKRVLDALQKLAADGDKHIVFPVHLNPYVRREVAAHIDKNPNIRLVEPLQYPDLIYLLANSWIVITDSGGIQEEAPSFHIPVVITRDTTERPEVVDAGFGHLVGCKPQLIIETVRHLTYGDHPTHVKGANPFGMGDAAQKIADSLTAVNKRRKANVALPSATDVMTANSNIG